MYNFVCVCVCVGGGPGNLETPLATPLPCDTRSYNTSPYTIRWIYEESLSKLTIVMFSIFLAIHYMAIC